MVYNPNLQNVAAVEPHPSIPGASLVRFRDGTSMPAPASVAARFNPSLASSGALAQNMSTPAPNASMTDWSAPVAPLPAAPAPAASAPIPMQRPPEQYAPMARPQAPVPMQRPAEQFAPTAPPVYPAAPTFEVPRGVSDPIDQDTGLRLSQLRNVYAPVAVGGRRAYDPEKDDASRRAVRETQTEQRAGMQQWDEDAHRQILGNQLDAAAYKAEADNLSAQTAVQAQRMYRQDLEQQARDAQAKQRADEQAWQAENDRLSREAQAVASREVDPGRIFSGARVFGLLSLAVAAGIRGWTSKGADNSVLDHVNRMIDRDVQVQNDEIARSKGTVDNALARNVQRYGSIEAARHATKAAMVQATLARFDETKAQLALPGQSAQIEATRKQLAASYADAFEQLKSNAAGTTTIQTGASMRAPVAAQSGYYRDPTDAEIEKRIARQQGISDRGAKINSERLGNENKQISNEYLAQRGGDPAKEKDLESQIAAYGQRRDANESAQAQLERFIAENGIKEDAHGNLIPPNDIAGFGRIGMHAPGAIVSQQGINNRAALEGINSAEVQASFGAATPDQVDYKRAQLFGSGDPAHITANLSQMRHKLKAQRDNLAGSFDPEVIARYERNKKFQRARSSDKAKGFEPVDLSK